MNTLFYIILFVFWTIFGSFASVIIYRLKSGEHWIFTGRSHCSRCYKILDFLQLVPILSWIIYKWKCKFCENKISKIYPILEVSTWFLFSLTWYFLIDKSLIFSFDKIELIKLLFFLMLAFFSIIYIFYDILFLEIADEVLITSIIITVIVLSIQTMVPWFTMVDILPVSNSEILISTQIYSIVLSILIIVWLYVIMFKQLHEVLDVIILLFSVWALYLFKMYFGINLKEITILNWLMWALWIFIFFFLQILVSRWKWMWWWDLRIAILVWLMMWTSLSFVWMMMTYIVWSIIWISLIIFHRIKNRGNGTKFNSEIPFWPFIWAGFYITIFFSEKLLDFVNFYL